MRILSGNIPQTYDLAYRRVKCPVRILRKLKNFLQIAGKLIRHFYRLAGRCIQLRDLRILIRP